MSEHICVCTGFVVAVLGVDSTLSRSMVFFMHVSVCITFMYLRDLVFACQCVSDSYSGITGC